MSFSLLVLASLTILTSGRRQSALGDSVQSCAMTDLRTGLDLPDDFWGTGDNAGLPSASYLGIKLAGSYDLYVVSLSGAPYRSVAHWSLVLSPPTPDVRAAWDAWHKRGGVYAPVLVLSGSLEWIESHQFDSNAKLGLDGPPIRPVNLSRGELPHALSLVTADLSDFFEVRTIRSDGSLFGSWAPGGIETLSLDGGGLELLEYPTGYFCAFPHPYRTGAG